MRVEFNSCFDDVPFDEKEENEVVEVYAHENGCKMQEVVALAKRHQDKWVLWIYSSLLPKTPQMGNNGKGIQKTVIDAYKKELRKKEKNVLIQEGGCMKQQFHLTKFQFNPLDDKKLV